MAFSDVFADGITRLATGLKLDKYVYAAHENWDNYKLNNEIAAGNEENDEKMEDMEGLPDNPYALYGMYNW